MTFYVQLSAILLALPLRTPGPVQDQRADSLFTPRDVTAIGSPDSPVRIDAASLRLEDGQWNIHCQLLGVADNPVRRVQTTVFVLDSQGAKLDSQVDDALLDGRLSKGERHEVSVRLRLALEDTNRVAIAISLVTTDLETWTYDRLDNDVATLFRSDTQVSHALQKPSQHAVKIGAVVALQEDDAPAVIEDVILVRGVTGAPVLARVAVRNRSDQPMLRLKINTMLFNEKAAIRTEIVGVILRAIPPQGSIVHEFRLSNVSAQSNWRVVVALSEAVTQQLRWPNEGIRERAKAALLEAR